MDSNTVKLKISSKIDKKAPVFLTEFSCGQLSRDLDYTCLKSEDDSEIMNRTAKRILVAEGKYLTYSGSAVEKRNAALKNYIGVRNKRTGKMKLYDSVIFNLDPYLPNSKSILQTTESSGDNYWEERKKLTAEFGSKASIRTLKMRSKLAVQDNSFEDSTQENSLFSSVSIFPTEQSQTVSYLPKINRDALSVDEVFNIYDIISAEEEINLQSYVDEWLSSYHVDPIAAKSNFCQYVASNIDNGLEDCIKLKYLLYYNYLVTFQHLNGTDIRKKDPAPAIPSLIRNSLIEKFSMMSKDTTGRNIRVLPAQLKDKLLGCIVVLALLIDNYVINTSQVATDLKKIAPKHLIQIAQTLGCHITTQKLDGVTIKFAEMKLPLASMPINFSKRQY